MPENQSQPRTEGYGNPRGEPRIAARAPERGPAARRPSDVEAAHAPQAGDPGLRPPEPRSFGSDDIEGVRPEDQARRFADYGGQGSTEADRLPRDASATPAGVDGAPPEAAGPGSG